MWKLKVFALLSIGLTLASCQAVAPQNAASSGSVEERLEVYFNDPLAGFPDMTDFEAQADGLDRALLELIDSAGVSLDIALYHLTVQDVIRALERACERDVTVRLIVEDDASRPRSVPGCVRLKLDGNDRLMHHKFAVVDGGIVWTGSANWTETSFYADANNALILQDADVFRAYQAEFEEMFSRERYGPAKHDTNDEHFTVNGTRVEIYFPPGDDARARLIELIGGAQESIVLAMNILTDDPLYDALRDALDRAVKIDALWDFQSWEMCQYSEADEFLDMGIGTWDALPGLLHHKYAVIDGKTVITGSANWSRSGMERNDENIVVVHDRSIAQRYLDNFRALQDDAKRYQTSSDLPPRVEVRHFDVARDAAVVQWRPRGLGVVERYEICRLSSRDADTCERRWERPGWAWYVVDREVTPGARYYYRLRSWDGAHWTGYSNTYEAHVPIGVPALGPEEADRELVQYRDETVAVRFTVTNRPTQVGEAGHVFLNAGEDYRRDFTAFIPGCALASGRFDGSGLDLFGLQGKTIEVTGELTEYNGPEIVVTGPWQIRVEER